MSSDRTLAVSAGILLIVATVASIAGALLSQPLIDDPDRLARLSANANQVAGSAILSFIAAGASAGIAIAMYPVLRRLSEGVALGSVVFRAIEAVMYGIGAVSLLSLVGLGRQSTGAGAADAASLHAISETVLGLREQVTNAGVLAFCVGAFLYYWLFYRSALIPRWLSGWGTAAIALSIVAWLLALFSQQRVTAYAILFLPIAVQEMVMAFWLIAKGFARADATGASSISRRASVV